MVEESWYSPHRECIHRTTISHAFRLRDTQRIEAIEGVCNKKSELFSWLFRLTGFSDEQQLICETQFNSASLVTEQWFKVSACCRILSSSIGCFRSSALPFFVSTIVKHVSKKWIVYSWSCILFFLGFPSATSIHVNRCYDLSCVADQNLRGNINDKFILETAKAAHRQLQQ